MINPKVAKSESLLEDPCLKRAITKTSYEANKDIQEEISTTYENLGVDTNLNSLN